MKRCMYCGQENQDIEETCTKCGNPLLDAAPSEEDDILEPASEDEAVPENAEDQENVFEEEAEAENEEDVFEEEPASDPEPEYEEVSEDQQYGGQAYGYDDEAQQYGEQPYDDEEDADDYDDDEDEDDEPQPKRMRVMPPLMKVARKRVKSFLFFLPTLVFTVAIIANIINIALGNSITNLSTVSNTLTKTFGSNAALTLFNTLIGFIGGVNPWLLIAVQIGLMIPAILLMFGLWGMFNGTSRRRMRISTTGYSLTMAAVILQFILTTAALLVVIVLTVSFVVAAGASGSTMSLILGIVLLLIIVIITVLLIMFYIQVIYSIRLIKRNVKTGEDYGVIPGYAIFMGVIGALLTGAAMLPMAPDDYIGLVAKGAMAVWLLLMSLWAIAYKATVKIK